MRDSVPSVPAGPAAVVSCHLERPLDDEAWRRFDALQRRRPGGFGVIALVRPPDPAYGEDEERWLERARAAAARAPVGLHTHWTSPTHARPLPDGGDPAGRVRREAAWMRERGLEPVFFCGGGWYSDDAVREAVASLGLVDCTPRAGAPGGGVLPTTHSLGALARAVLGSLPRYVHAYFHDYDLLDPVRRRVLVAALHALGARRSRAIRSPSRAEPAAGGRARRPPPRRAARSGSPTAPGSGSRRRRPARTRSGTRAGAGRGRRRTAARRRARSRPGCRPGSCRRARPSSGTCRRSSRRPAGRSPRPPRAATASGGRSGAASPSLRGGAPRTRSPCARTSSSASTRRTAGRPRSSASGRRRPAAPAGTRPGSGRGRSTGRPSASSTC